MFNYNHLYYFYVTAKLGGVMNAARSLKTAQPSLSAQLKTLESELGVVLFHKVGRRLVLTPAGERAYGFCRKIFEAAEEFSDHLKQSEGGRGHRCRIGVTREIDRPFIADILSALLRGKPAHEQPLLTMTSEDHGALIESLRSGDLDAVITNHPVYGSDTIRAAQLSMPVIAVATPALVRKHSLKTRDSLSKTLKSKDLGLLLPTEQLKIRIESDLFLQRLKIRNPIVLESDMLAVIIRAAMDGVGVALIPRHYVVKELGSDALIPLDGGRALWRHQILLATRKTKLPDPVVGQLAQHFLHLSAKTR